MKEVLEMHENITNAKLVALYELKEEILEEIHPIFYGKGSREDEILDVMYYDIIGKIDKKIDELRCPF
ncbi:MAG: hypothetical protein ACI4KH_06020 [Oscillospiraceae bacterium]